MRDVPECGIAPMQGEFWVDEVNITIIDARYITVSRLTTGETVVTGIIFPLPVGHYAPIEWDRGMTEQARFLLESEVAKLFEKYGSESYKEVIAHLRKDLDERIKKLKALNNDA